jgi:hypothetical protein
MAKAEDDSKRDASGEPQPTRPRPKPPEFEMVRRHSWGGKKAAKGGKKKGGKKR